MNKSNYYLLGLIIFISSVCLFACSSDSDEPGGKTDKERIEMQVAVCPVKKGEAIERPVPRMIVTVDGWTVTELYDENHPKSIVYHICKGQEAYSALMIAEGSYMWLVQYDNARNTVQNDAMLVKSESDGTATVITGIFNIGDNSFIQKGIAHIDLAAEVTAVASPMSRYDDGMDDVRELVLKDLIEPIADAHEKLGRLDIKSLDPYVSTIDKVVIPVMKLHLYSNNPEKLSEISGGYLDDAGMEYVIDPLFPGISGMRSLYIGARKAYETYRNWKINSEDAAKEEVDPDWLNVRLSDIGNRYRGVTDGTFEVYDNRIDGSLSCKVSGVGTTGATLSMSASVTGFVTQSGYVVYGPDGKKTYPSSVSAQYSLSGLTSGVEYHVYAYAIVNGVEIKSDIVNFRTLAEVKITPESLVFDFAGGTEKVEIVLPSDKWQWAVGKKPSWCTTSEKGSVLTVKASASSASREGEIVIYVYSPDGNGTEYVVKIIQTNMSYMVFKGKLRISTDGMVQDTDYMYMLQRSGKSFIIMAGGCPVSQILFSNWTVSGKKPESFQGSNAGTSFSTNISGQTITIKGTTAIDRTKTSFSVVIDLAAGKIRIDDRGESMMSDGKKTATAAVGTLTLVPFEDLM